MCSTDEEQIMIVALLGAVMSSKMAAILDFLAYTIHYDSFTYILINEFWNVLR